MQSLESIARQLALTAFQIKAVKIQPDNPFKWAGGWWSPIYNDNRLFLYFPSHRDLIREGLCQLVYEHTYDEEIIAGTATAGIPHATLLADRLDLPLIYIRPQPKGHGMMNQIEGIAAEDDLGGGRVVVVEDLISTGMSSAAAVAAVRKANGRADLCLSIFNYGFPEAAKMFAGKLPYNKDGDVLETPCMVDSIFDYPLLLEVGVTNGYIKKEHQAMLEGWSEEPARWSAEFEKRRKV